MNQTIIQRIVEILKNKLSIQIANQTSNTTALTINPLIELIEGIKLLASGLSHIILLPLYYFGLNIPVIVVQLLYLGFIGWLAFKIVGNLKWWVVIMFILIFISIFGFSI